MKFLVCFKSNPNFCKAIDHDKIIDLKNCEKLTSFYIKEIKDILTEKGYNNTVLTNIIKLEQD